MDGIALLLSSICFNSTYCDAPPMVPNLNFVEFYKGESLRGIFLTSVLITFQLGGIYYSDVKQSMLEKEKQLEKIARDLKGQTLMITTLEDYPLSYVERDKITGKFELKGRAFDFLEILMKKFDFKYELKMPNYNIAGSSNDSTGSIMDMLVRKVTINNSELNKWFY